LLSYTPHDYQTKENGLDDKKGAVNEIELDDKKIQLNFKLLSFYITNLLFRSKQLQKNCIKKFCVCCLSLTSHFICSNYKKEQKKKKICHMSQTVKV
jgi:hypothetical protein